MTDDLDRRPATLSSALAVAAALFVSLLNAVQPGFGLLASAVGVFVLVAGVVVGSRGTVTAATALLLVGTFAHGTGGASPAVLLPAVMASVLAWDLGEQAINVGEQLGRDADTSRLELTHAAASTAVAAGAGALGYGIYAVAAGGQPVTALVFLLVAALALSSALRN